MSSLMPLGVVGFQLAIMTLIVGFTSHNSLLRPGALALIVFCAYRQLSLIENIESPGIRAFVGAAAIFPVIHYIDTVLMHRWEFTAQGPTSAKGGLTPMSNERKHVAVADGVLERVRFGVHVSLQTRYTATKWPVKNIPPFSRKDSSFVPGKAEFLRTNLIKWGVYILLIDSLNLIRNDGDNSTIFSSDRIAFFSRLNNVSGEEVLARISGVSAYWILQYIFLDLVYTTLAIVVVGLNFTSVSTWNPVFGSLGDSYSIRQFWGYFYHQLIRRGCSGIAHSVTYSFLHLKKGGLTGRYLFILLTFAVSGVFHHFCDITQAIPWEESGAMEFFCVQTLGIMLEDAVQALYRSRKGSKAGQTHIVAKMLGYIWVVAWLVWSTPRWAYPAMQRDKGESILPFRLVSLLKA